MPAVFILIFGVVFALFSGGDWRVVALGGLFSVFLGAMRYHMPLIDWLYPTDDNDRDTEI